MMVLLGKVDCGELLALVGSNHDATES